MQATWLLSLQCMQAVAAGATYGCSPRHLRLQAEWLLSLVEDLERHASACQVGCAPQEGRIALGGSIMAWQDEWWKGRVIEAVNFDSRTATMGGLCPDSFADFHSSCGYPSAAQPDTYANERALTPTPTQPQPQPQP